MKRPDKNSKSDWNWSTYYAGKIKKLQEQFIQYQDDLDENNSLKTLFKNIGIQVVGYTNPTSIELKSLMLKHGGIFYDYPNERVTYIIAANLSTSKSLMFKNKTILRPEWILDCIKDNKLLDIREYILQTSLCDKAQHKLTAFLTNNQNEKPNTSNPLKRKSCHLTSEENEEDYEPVLIDIS